MIPFWPGVYDEVLIVFKTSSKPRLEFLKSGAKYLSPLGVNKRNFFNCCAGRLKNIIIWSRIRLVEACQRWMTYANGLRELLKLTTTPLTLPAC